MSQPSGGKARKPRRFAPLIVVAGLVGALAMSLAMTNTLSAFIATIVNTNDTAAAGSVVLQETNSDASTTCNSTDSTTVSTNSSNCATINKYGGSTTMVPSNSAGTTNTVNTTVNFKNTGSSTATSFTMGFGACTQGRNGSTYGSATDYCSKLHVKVVSGSTVVQADTTAAALANTTVSVPVPAANSGSTVPFTFTTYLDNSAGNTYQGLSASQPITWTLTA